jgi:LuxR family maltose regulon positive regulatory protein
MNGVPDRPNTPSVLRSLQSDVGSPSPQPLVELLTNCELDVLDLPALRLSCKEIPKNLFISATTVKGHLQNIYSKLNVRKRCKAVEKANKIGIFSGR